ncbi:regulatory protein, crp family [Anaerovirgula multivorans]|uniref:Regulatory protein, crp family n=2 Tax=Anaerovirgula multivorans TaxID=312168 RepID=A0A238ZV94_9FIRM|nr:regulatory protein, crp family [Anaerovirgula multivorans]
MILSMADEENKVTLSMSKKDLADYIGTSQETFGKFIVIIVDKN